MGEGYERGAGSKKRLRLVAQLDRMVGSGRVTPDEAAALRAAAGPDEFDEVVRGIRVRHAATKLGSAVADGSMSREEADGLLVRLKDGEHPTSLRAHLGSLRRGAGGKGDGPGSDPPG